MQQEKSIPPQAESTNNSTDEKSKSEEILSGVISSTLIALGTFAAEFVIESVGKVVAKKLSDR